MKTLWFVGLAVGLWIAAAADAQTTTRLRGTITAIDGNTMSVKSRDGKDVKVQLPDNVSVAVAKAIRFEDIRQGDYVGATTTTKPDGTLSAVELHYLPPAVPEGQGPWDLQPGSTMTNAKVSSIVAAADKRELTLQYKDGTARIYVPENAPIVRAVPGSRSDLRAGEYVFAAVQTAPDGTMTAPRVQVSKDGVRPPQ
ncbi:MAG TPA: hypothetical protein VGK44_05025 [Casimicrobiaceae bacterium]